MGLFSGLRNKKSEQESGPSKKELKEQRILKLKKRLIQLDFSYNSNTGRATFIGKTDSGKKYSEAGKIVDVLNKLEGKSKQRARRVERARANL